MKKFEYKIVPIPIKSYWTGKVNADELLAELNQLGKQGWEAISLSPYDPNTGTKNGFIILKKEIN